MGSFGHFLSSLFCKGNCKDGVGIHLFFANEVGNFRGDNTSFSRTSSRQNQQRFSLVNNSLSLLLVQNGKVFLCGGVTASSAGRLALLFRWGRKLGSIFWDGIPFQAHTMAPVRSTPLLPVTNTETILPLATKWA